MSKLSFQYGLSVFLITPVVFVCSPLTVATAKGSGKPVSIGQQVRARCTVALILTEDISLVETVSCDDCEATLLVAIRFLQSGVVNGGTYW